MRVGVIGGGIVGSAIAATIKKYDYSKTIQVTIIDDKRPNQTSQAGQGYLWSIHRCEFEQDQGEVLRTTNLSTKEDYVTFPKRLFSCSPLEYSKKAKEAWIELLGDNSADVLLEKRGSMLVAPSSSKEKLLEYYDNAKHLLGKEDLTYLPDASSCNKVLLPSVSGIHYQGDDYTCSPPALIDALMEMFEINFEHRTVINLESEREKYDHLICCTGPWINELKNLGVEPVRGVLLQLSPGEALKELNKKKNFGSSIPMMEFGYGSLGVHFTLSLRNDNWLLGASREEVSFSLENIDEVKQTLMERSKEYLKEDVLGDILSQKIGFRPSYSQNDDLEENYPFRIKGEENIIYCYGFEGQGVLYGALAGKEIENMLLSDSK